MDMRLMREGESERGRAVEIQEIIFMHTVRSSIRYGTVGTLSTYLISE